jgi:hypothetical protein
VTLVAAQAVGAFCFGVGYAAIALRIGTIWPLMVLHALTDLFAAVGALPKIPILVGQDIVLLIVGLWLLRGNRAHQDVPDWPTTTAPHSTRSDHPLATVDRTRFGGHPTRLLQFLSTGD